MYKKNKSKPEMVKFFSKNQVMKPLIGVGGIRRINPIAIPLNPRPLIGGIGGIRKPINFL
jgi:hypothetical protein